MKPFYTLLFTLFFLASSAWASCSGSQKGSWSTDNGTTYSNQGDTKDTNHVYYTIEVKESGNITFDIKDMDSGNWDNLEAKFFNNTNCDVELWTNKTTEKKETNTLTYSVSLAVGTYVMHIAGSSDDKTDYEFSLEFISEGSSHEFIENADDICYEEAEYSGTKCVDMGMCKGGLDCTTNYPLRNQNQNNDSLENVLVYYDETGMSGSMFSSSGVLPDGDSSTQSSIDFGPFGFFGSATEFSFDNPIASDDEDTSIWFKQLMAGSCLNTEKLFASYTIGEQKYRGSIQPCAGTKIGFEQEIYQISEDYDKDIGTTSLLETKVVLSKTVDYDITFNYTTTNGTAIAGSDYVSDSGTITIPAGEQEALIYIAIFHDLEIELQENFFLEISNILPSNGDVQIGTNPAEIQILEQGSENIPICYEDDFNSELDNKWRTLYSSGSFNPGTFDGRMRLTPGQNNISTAVTKDYEFTSKHNMIIVEFEQFAYGGCGASHGGLGTYGADGIVAVLYDSQIGPSPTPGAYGGSMGYAQGHGKAGFEGGWLGLGIDEYGNFANPTEGRVGGIGFKPNRAVIRGDGSGSDGYDFLAASNELSPTVAVKNTDIPQPGHKYRMTADARDPAHLYITLERDSGNGYQVIINKFDAKDPQYNQTTTPELVRFALTSGTGGGCNIHEIDELVVKGVCRKYNPGIIDPGTSLADIVDDFSMNNYNFLNKKYLKTKVADKLEPLTAVHLNNTGDAEIFTSSRPDEPLHFKVMPYMSNEECTQRAPLFDQDGNPLVIDITHGNASAIAFAQMPNQALSKARFSISALDMSKLYDASGETCLLNSSETGNLQGIGQCINSEFKYKKIFGNTAWERCYNNNGEPCRSQNHGVGTGIYANDYGCLMCTLDSNTSCSSDNFALRPHAFKAFGENRYKRAGENFDLIVKGVNKTENDKTVGTSANILGVNDYNASLSSLDFGPLPFNETDPNISTSCPNDGTFSVNNSNETFDNGVVTANVSYSETGILDVTIGEKEGSEFAIVDQNDTSDTQRYIQATSVTLDKTDISKNTLLSFIPFSIVTEANITSTGNLDWLYFYVNSFQNPQAQALENMSAAINYKITAQNMAGQTTKNFTKTCFPNTNAPSINGLKKNTTFDLFLDFKLQGTNATNQDLVFYVEDKDSNQAVFIPNTNYSVNNTVASYQQLVFPQNFTSGVSTTTIHLNVLRTVDTRLNPIEITFVDANTSTSWSANSGATNDFQGTTFANESKIFLSGRSFTPRQSYVTDFGNAPIFYEVYCNPADTVDPCDANLLLNGDLNAINVSQGGDTRWRINPNHTNNFGTVVNINQKGLNNNVAASNILLNSSTLTYDNGRGRPYTATMQHQPDLWLVYDPYNPATVTNEFEAEFIGGNSSWAGKTKTQDTSQTDAAQRSNRKLVW